ncbi:MAG TPA: ATP-dependent sacrificial sulfur transferase LarE [Bacteroidales bacterium]|nr:ATP-dependent sacrificial sulfur transferase LarE [Bacteroidales bacterium]
MTPKEKLLRLRAILSEMGNVVIAYSGGVDSAFLLKVAVDTLGAKNVKAILAISPTYPSREYDRALDTAARIGVEVEIIHTKEVDDPKFVNNPVNRCYFCKHELFTKVAEYMEAGKFKNMVDGSNMDDMSDHRPGRKALQEKNVRSPLQEAEMTKNDIRELSKQLELPTWDRDALACLSSRFPYGETIDLKKLEMVDSAENFLADLGFRNVRARHEKNSIRIEISPAQIKQIADDHIRTQIVTKMKELGYKYVSIDLEGYRQGSLNEELKPVLK